MNIIDFSYFMQLALLGYGVFRKRTNANFKRKVGTILKLEIVNNILSLYMCYDIPT